MTTRERNDTDGAALVTLEFSDASPPVDPLSPDVLVVPPIEADPVFVAAVDDAVLAMFWPTHQKRSRIVN